MQLLTETLRFTAFAAEPVDYRQMPVAGWWQLLANAQPEQVTTNTVNAQSIADGPFAGGRLAVASAPGRVDFVMSAVPPTGVGEWPAIGPWPDATGAFVPALLRELPELLSVNRIAFGAMVASPVTDRATGYRTMQSALSELRIQLPPDTEDFLLQLNRPVTSHRGPEGMVLNRVARWAVIRLSPVVVQVQVGAAPRATVLSPSAEEALSYSVRVELDFSTPPDWSETIPVEQTRELMSELVEISKEYIGERLR